MKSWPILALLLLSPLPLLGADPATDAIYGLTKLHAIHLGVSANDYKAMDPPPVNPFAPKPAAGRPAFGSPDAGAGNMNFEFTYVHASFESGGLTIQDVGLRYKGSGTYLMAQQGAKRSFKIDFDRYDSKGNFHGLTKTNLNCSVIDPTKCREALAYTVFRAAGLPCSRTAFVDVTITVPGKFDREYLGIYTLVEQVDKAFLKQHFGTSEGLLLKPEGIRGLPHLGTEQKDFELAYNAKTTGSDEAWTRLIEFTQLINKAPGEEFRAKINDYLDVDAFTKFLAANALTVSLDSFIGLGHNYYLYYSPTTKKFSFFPWDFDLAFGGFIMFGKPEQQAEASIEHPHIGDNKLIDKLLAMPDVNAKYRNHLRRLHEELFVSGKLAKDAELVEQTLRASLDREKKAVTNRKEAFGGLGMQNPFAAPGMSLKVWIEKRTASVTNQLAGKSKGIIPGTNPNPRPATGPGPQLSKPLLDRLDANKDGKVSEVEFQTGMKQLFAEWDKDGTGSLDQKKIAEGLQRLLPPPGK
jgi:spore coat protein H